MPFPFGPSTIANILEEGVANHPNRLALIDGDETWTYAELEAVVAAQATNDATPTSVTWHDAHRASAALVIGVLADLRAGRIWVASKTEPDMSAFSGLTAAGTDALHPDSPAIVAFTSGTTGEPKRVVHSHRGALLPAVVSSDVEPPAEGERIGTPLDLRIGNVMILGPLSAFVRRGTFVVMRDHSASGMAADIERHNITRLIAVPTLAYDLVEGEGVHPEQLASLDRVILGGGGARPEMLQSFTDRFGVRPTLSYGLSEAPTGVVRESLDDPIGSGKGHPLPHVEVVITNPDTGEQLPIGEVGEVCLRSASSGLWANTWTGTLGYLGDPEATKQLFRDGLLHTGDVGVVDIEGRVAITGRLSQVIIRGGQNVYPEAVRRTLLLNSSVADAHVVGYPDERLGEGIGAAIVLVDGTDFLSFSGYGLDKVVILDELPRNHMGKVAGLPDDLFAD